MSYAMYLRKSRADVEAEARGEGETLSRHKAALEKLAALQGNAIGEIYAEVLSGETIAQRPQMRRLLSDLASGRWEGVYVMEVERLARGDTLDQGRVCQAFLYSGARIITPGKTYDPENEFDQEYFEFGLFMSRREYKTINRRIQAGRLQSVSEGKFVSSRPAYGYHRVKIAGDKGYTLEAVPEEAAVIRNIFFWYVEEDLGVARIADRLSDAAVPPGAQATGWSPCRVYRILSNPVYVGLIRWGHARTQRRLTPLGVEKSVHLTSDCALCSGLHEAIVSRDIFDRAQALLKRRRLPMRGGMPQKNPLAGVVRCKACGRVLRGLPASGRQAARLYCATRGCPTVRSYLGPVEEALLDALRAFLTPYPVKPGALLPKEGLDPSLGAADALKREQETLLLQRDSLNDLVERGVYSPEEFVRRRDSLDARLHALTQRAERLHQSLAAAPPCAPAVLPPLAHALDLYALCSPAGRGALLRAVLSRVDYAKTQRGSHPNPFVLDVYPRITPLKEEA